MSTESRTMSLHGHTKSRDSLDAWVKDSTSNDFKKRRYERTSISGSNRVRQTPYQASGTGMNSARPKDSGGSPFLSFVMVIAIVAIFIKMSY